MPLVKVMESAAEANILSILKMAEVDEEMAEKIKDEAGNICMNVSAEHREKSVEKVKELVGGGGDRKSCAVASQKSWGGEEGVGRSEGNQ